MSERPLWTVEAMAAAMGARREGALPDSVRGISIDSRSIGPGEAFFAIKGDSRDGHDFVDNALQAGAGACGGGCRQARPVFPRTRRCWWSPMCSKACAISRAPRARAARPK